jgi:hypothetical protein
VLAARTVTKSDAPTAKQNKEFFSYTDALIFFGLMIVEHFVLAWLDLSTGTYLTILAASILGIISAKLFWRILTR